MSYHQAIARKYRPQSFEEVVGQEAVVTTLKNAIRSGRIHPAYLFTGARGIGKTSLARIFAKALQCETGPTETPCQQCSFCKDITAGNSLDVQEIDGASNTSVEDVRELREGLKYLPVAARTKIFIIDEVHMLSTNAFNALLKTLEEPPPHVLFLMATTESHKIPATILSRCQCFDLRRLTTQQVLQQLQSICALEQVSFEPEALKVIAKESEGSLRDSQSLLDQAIAYSAGQILLKNVLDLLGIGDQESLIQITDAVIGEQTKRALEIINNLYQKGSDLRYWVTQWLKYWQTLFLYQVTQQQKLLEDWTETERQALIRQANTCTTERLDLGFSLLHRGLEEIAKSEFQKILLEVLVLRLCHSRNIVSMTQMLDQLRKQSSSTTPSIKPIPSSLSTSSKAEKNLEQEEEGKRSLELVSAVPFEAEKATKNPTLQALFVQLTREAPRLASLMEHIEETHLEENSLIFTLDQNSIWWDLISEKKPLIEQISRNFLQKDVQVVLRSTQNFRSISRGEINSEVLGQKLNHPLIQAAVELFDGTIENETIETLTPHPKS